MDFSHFMLAVGMGLLLLVAPLLALITLVLAAIAEKLSGFFQSLIYFFYYPLWLAVWMVITLIPALGKSQWWLLFLLVWLLPASIPHAILWIKGKRTNNRKKILVGILGVAATMAATVGIELICYAARFY